MTDTKEEAFEIADETLSKGTTSAINRALNRIQTMVDQFTPIRTVQDFALLSANFIVLKGSVEHTGIKPISEVAIFGTSPNYSGFVYVGRMGTDGVITMEENYGTVSVHQIIRI